MEDEMNEKEITAYALEKLLAAGAHKAIGELHYSEQKELNLENNRLTLLRSTVNQTMNLTALVDDRKGNTSLNKLNKSSIDEACEQVVGLASSFEPDPANEIAEKQPPGRYRAGRETVIFPGWRSHAMDSF